MKIFIIEDDRNIIKILQKIIVDRDLGQLLGYAMDGAAGIKEIQALKPDIVLLDLLMPGKDGLSLVKEAKALYPDMLFIMISQVSSKNMVGKAYQNGVEYYIYKPINAVEVENVILKVGERLRMNRTLIEIQKLFGDNTAPQIDEKKDYVEHIKNVMQKIGIMGESGTQDIIDIVRLLLKENKNVACYTIKDLCNHFTNNPKTMEQRIRRTASTGMVNIANLGIEDYMNEVFVEYANSLYNFHQVKREMDFIRGKSKARGKVHLKKFIDGMVFYCRKAEGEK
ncbi:response regulator [Clostridiaceae bacterium 35-E11]